ncbi:glycosyltransferase family 8 protein [Actinoplanes siamensis]|uniref:General stress protein A n=1 Tax=Actinoplanes siamensis TaxID=1223317 RepID=A0A919TNT2_9ACTN|nr:glycosyltransferase family 8 protein [Actinoplanes siamensis]GIF08230.1 general stress protein A [Actinoplanes siamensis]
MTDNGSATLAPIVCCLDQRYIVAFCVLLESLARGNPDSVPDLRVVVLHEGLPADGVDRITAHARRLGLRLDCIRIDAPDERYPSTTDGPHGDQLTRSIYLRLMIADVLRDVPRALYLDSDILIRRDIRPLLELPMDGFAIAAAQDPIQPTLGEGYTLPGWREEGIPPSREYFNSGVLLLDLDVCRSQGVLDRAKKFLVDYPERAICLDQDALNWAVDDAWLRLDRYWNTYTAQAYASSTAGPERLTRVPMEVVRRNEQECALLHFAGPRKPWLDSEADNPTPSYRDYRELLAAVRASEAMAA